MNLVTPPDSALAHSRPRERWGNTVAFSVGEVRGYLTTSVWDDRVQEVFIKVSKQGSTLAGLADSLAILISNALQHDTPLVVICESLRDIRFEPFGATDDPDIPVVSSISDYIARRLWRDYGDGSELGGAAG